eukprot:Hpha_TRINITY_DN16943_c3_g9::TRINITY_DN16943_c3_g9_i1::g.51728::m.51728
MRRGREDGGMSIRSEAPHGYFTDHEAGDRIGPGDSASQPGASTRNILTYTDDEGLVQPQPVQTRRRDPHVTFNAPPRGRGGDDDDLVSQLAERSVRADSMDPDQVGRVKRLGCDKVMNFNCVLADVKVKIERVKRTIPGRGPPPAQLRLEHCVIPSSKLVRLRQMVGETANTVIARGTTPWAILENDVADFRNAQGGKREAWHRDLYIPDAAQKPKQDHLNRRYIEVRVWEGDHTGKEEAWRHPDGSTRAELVFKESGTGTGKARRRAHLRVKGPDEAEYEFDMFVTMRASATKPPAPGPRAYPPAIPAAAKRRVRSADPDAPPPGPVSAPTGPTQGYSQPRGYVRAREDAARRRADRPAPCDACKIARNITIGVVGGAVIGCGVGALWGGLLGGS